MRSIQAIRDGWQRLTQWRAARRHRDIERSLASRHEEPVLLPDPRFGRGPRP